MITKEYIVFLDRASLNAELRIPDFDHAWVEQPSCAPEAVAGWLVWPAAVMLEAAMMVSAWK